MIQFQPKRVKEILNFRESPKEKENRITGQYAHEADNKIYYQVYGSKNDPEIHVAEYDGEKYVKPDNNCVLKGSLAAHNFRVFVDTNPNSTTRLKAVGGFHTSYPHPHLNASDNLDILDCHDPVWPNLGKKRFVIDKKHPAHANGLYIFESEDGKKWTTINEKPVLSDFTLCKDRWGDLPIGTMASDTLPTAFYDHNISSYVLYTRANIKLGVRHVLRTTSKNLINWTQPTLIQCSPAFGSRHDNLYYSGVYPYPKEDFYIAFPPHFKNIIKDAEGHHREYYNEKTLVMVSRDGIQWKTIGEMFVHDGSNPEWGGHMRAPHVLGFKIIDDKVLLHVHEHFLTFENKMVLYTLEKEEFEGLIKNALNSIP